MDAQLVELLPFLHDRNPQVRRVALENLLGHTPAGSQYRGIFFAGMDSRDIQSETTKDTEVSRDLKLLCRDQLAIAHDAFRALINLSDSLIWVNTLSEPTFLVFLVSYILHPPSVLADLAAMLLSNLTAHHSSCANLLSMKIPVILDLSLNYRYYPTQSRSGTSPAPSLSANDVLDIAALPLLVDAFAHSAKTGQGYNHQSLGRKGELHFLSSVFANISVSHGNPVTCRKQTPPGRLFFMTPSPVDALSTQTPTVDMEYPISKLTSFTEHFDIIRRGGVVSVIKNCSFHASGHRALLSVEDAPIAVPPSTVSAPGVNVLPAILLPLAGPEEFDLEDQEKLPLALQFLPPTKKRESDSVLRLTHIETLLLLCTTRWGRDFLRQNGTYEIVRTMHETEHVDKISEHIERLVNILQRDEGVETKAEAEGVLDQDQEATLEDEDERIEEV
ncbi:DUF383-domain-containing protein [Ramaria rubella]|nr:DUF383-domain-containing protein [Ramaria rubella]